MKTACTTFLICSFLAVALFGVFAMNNGSGHDGCIAAATQKTPCPENNVSEFIAFHLGALKIFSTAVFGVLLFAMVLLLGVFAGISHPLGTFASRFAPQETPRLQLSRWQRRFLRWLAFHENSPSSL